jgi:hypothetical protein
MVIAMATSPDGTGPQEVADLDVPAVIADLYQKRTGFGQYRIDRPGPMSHSSHSRFVGAQRSFRENSHG